MARIYRVALLVLAAAVPLELHAADGNRLTYLDETDPYYVHRNFPKLTTPQWVGEDGVEAVVILAIDDMRGHEKWEKFLRPILNRLKRIDGRAPVSIMTCSIDPNHPHLQAWLKEGVSLECHTVDHPCPLLQGGDFAKAKSTYDRCVDLLSLVPNSKPVAFRVPCCDSLNTPSPRFFAEIFNKTTPKGNFLQIDSSVFNVFTANDPTLPRDLVLESGRERFRKYLPRDRTFVNTIEDYPYPYVIRRLCWEFPCVTPSDWQANHLHKPNNPITVRDWQAALDCTVIKQGVFPLVFHPHGWIKAEQIIDLIDYAVAKHGKKVKFLTFREALERLSKNLLAGQPLRELRTGGDNGVRLTTIHGYDEYVSVITDNKSVREARLWIEKGHGGFWKKRDVAAARPRWAPKGYSVYRPIAIGGAPEYVTEYVVANDKHQAVFVWNGGPFDLDKADFNLPPGAKLGREGVDYGLRFIDLDGDGLDDVVFSNEKEYGIYLFTDMEKGWSRKVMAGKRGDPGALPMISRNGTNNGFWIHSRHLWWQNEHTALLKDHVDRRSFNELLKDVEPQARSPEASLRSIQVRPGFTVELVAAEPLVEDPIAFAWGPDGKLWVVEMTDYPLGVDGKGKPGGRIKCLESTKGDGKYDKATVFLDNLPFPTGVMPWRKGVLVACAPDIFYAEDTDGDGKADRREVLYTGFTEGNQQHRVNSFVWGLDNWIYMANGDSGGRVRSVKTGKVVDIRGRDFRIRPDTGDIDLQAGQTQYGRSRDDWGNWFGCNNSNPMWHYVLADHYLRRNPHVAAPDPRVNVSVTPGASRVYPISRTLPRFNDPGAANHFTSACSAIVYRDELFGPAFANNTLVSEPVHNLIHREVMTAKGVTFKSRRAADEENSEFLASSDNWFRPTTIQTGPDGALWIADMYRAVIEHPEWIPKDWQKKLDLRAGHDKGRIYRVYPVGTKPRPIPQLDKLDVGGLVAALDSPNGWQRDMAQMMLLWRFAGQPEAPARAAAIRSLEQLARESKRPLARLHALCTLEGLDALTPELLKNALADPHPGVRRHAVRLCEGRFSKFPELGRAVIKLVEDPDAQVRLQFASTLGEWDDTWAGRTLGQLAIRNARDRYLRAAVLSSVHKGNLGDVVIAVLEARNDETVAEMIEQLSQLAITLGDRREITRLLLTIANSRPGKTAAWQFAALAGLLDALDRRGSSLATLKKDGDEEMKETIDDLELLFTVARATVMDKKAPQAVQLQAVRLLGRGLDRQEEDLTLLGRLLNPRTPGDLQAASVAELGRLRSPRVPGELLRGWKSCGPALRTQVLDVLLQREEWVKALVEAIEKEQVDPSEIDAARRQRLLQHKTAAIRARAAKLFAGSINPDRQKVIDAYKGVLTMKGDPRRGVQVFAKHCAACHKLGDVGQNVGPDLASLGDKSPEALLIAIFDPNRAVEARYVNYVAETKNGRTFTGVLTSETGASVTLVGPDGKAQVLLRTDLESLASTGKSAMAEGLEKDLSAQDVADVIAHIRGTRPP